MRHLHIWRATSGQKTIEIEKFKMAAKTGSDAKVETNTYLNMIVFDLLNVKIGL